MSGDGGRSRRQIIQSNSGSILYGLRGPGPSPRASLGGACRPTVQAPQNEVVRRSLAHSELSYLAGSTSAILAVTDGDPLAANAPADMAGSGEGDLTLPGLPSQA